VGREPEAAVYASMRVHPLRLTLPFLRMMSLDISKAFERDSTSMNQRWFFLFVPMRMVLSREGEQMFLKVVVFMRTLRYVRVRWRRLRRRTCS